MAEYTGFIRTVTRFRWLAALFVAVCAFAQQRLTLQQAGSRTGSDFVPAYEGQEAVVTGQMTLRPIVVGDSDYLAIQDEAGYGLALLGAEWRFKGLEPGDWLEATGTIVRRGGRPVLLPREVHKTGHSQPPAPVTIKPAEAASFRYLGVLISVESVVTDLDQNAGGDLLLIGDKRLDLTVFLPRLRRDSGPQLSGFRTGDRVRVTGIASQYSTLPPYDHFFQILVPGPAAVTILERGWIIQPPVLVGTLLLAGVILAVWWIREQRMATLRKQMRVLNALGEEVIGATSPAEILRRLTVTLPSLTGATGVGLYVQNRGTKILRSVHSASDAPESIDLAAPEAGLPSAVAACYGNRTLLAIPDTRRSPFFREQDGDRAPRSMLLVPMLAQSELVGVLELRHTENFHYFGANEQTAMQHLSNQVAAALRLQEQHSMREQLFRSEKLAAAGQLISEVAEELRSPLESIVRLASAVSSDSTGAPRHELNSIADEARRASEIVSRLVSFGRVERSEVEPVDLNGLLSDLLRFRAPEWKIKGVEIQSQLAQKRATVMGSPGQIEQVLLNLLVDAEKAAAEAREKVITVSTSLLAKRALVEILYPTRSSDFPRPDSAPPDSVGSGALGLGVCRGIIQNYGGEFRVVRVSPTQARFDVELPLAEHRLGSGAPGDFGEASRQLTILIVEPDTKVQRELLQTLGNRGDRVVPVSSGEEAVDIVDRMRFDMVICALRLQGLNWVQFYEHVRYKIGGFALLTDGFNNDLSAAFRPGEGFILTKPIDENELYRICRIIEERATVNE